MDLPRRRLLKGIFGDRVRVGMIVSRRIRTRRPTARIVVIGRIPTSTQNPIGVEGWRFGRQGRFTRHSGHGGTIFACPFMDAGQYGQELSLALP